VTAPIPPPPPPPPPTTQTKLDILVREAEKAEQRQLQQQQEELQERGEQAGPKQQLQQQQHEEEEEGAQVTAPIPAAKVVVEQATLEEEPAKVVAAGDSASSASGASEGGAGSSVNSSSGGCIIGVVGGSGQEIKNRWKCQCNEGQHTRWFSSSSKSFFAGLSSSCGYTRKKIAEDGNCLYASIVGAMGGYAAFSSRWMAGEGTAAHSKQIGSHLSAILALRAFVAQSVTIDTFNFYVMEARM
jgi:hypothetical protein